jgi:hypothetical protein
VICTVIQSPRPSFSMLCPVNRKGKHEIDGEKNIASLDIQHSYLLASSLCGGDGKCGIYVE